MSRIRTQRDFEAYERQRDNTAPEPKDEEADAIESDVAWWEENEANIKGDE